jgi:hypothetical protein
MYMHCFGLLKVDILTQIIPKPSYQYRSGHVKKINRPKLCSPLYEETPCMIKIIKQYKSILIIPYFSRQYDYYMWRIKLLLT